MQLRHCRAPQDFLCMEHHGCLAAGLQHRRPLRPQGCSFSSNSAGIGERRAAGAGAGAAARPGPALGRGKGPCRAVQPRRCESADISYRPCSNFPSSPAVAALAAGRGSAALGPRAGGDELLPSPEPRSGLGTAAAPPRSVIPTSSTPWLPSNRHLVEEEEQEKEEQDGLTQTLPEPPPLPWGQWESGRASHWIHSQAVASPGQAPKQPQCLSQATASAEA